MTHTDHSGWLGLTRGSSANNLSGVLWPEHLDGTVPIDFALAMWVDSARSLGSGASLAPSRTSDGGGGSTKLPEGARLRLRAGFDLSAYPRVAAADRRRAQDQGSARRRPARRRAGPDRRRLPRRRGTALPFASQYGSGQLPVALLRNMEVIAWSSADILRQSYTIDRDTAVCGTPIR